MIASRKRRPNVSTSTRDPTPSAVSSPFLEAPNVHANLQCTCGLDVPLRCDAAAFIISKKNPFVTTNDASLSLCPKQTSYVSTVVSTPSSSSSSLYIKHTNSQTAREGCLPIHPIPFHPGGAVPSLFLFSAAQELAQLAAPSAGMCVVSDRLLPPPCMLPPP